MVFRHIERPPAGHENRSAGLGEQAKERPLVITASGPAVTENPRERARLVKTVVSNCSFDRGSLSPTDVKPFDLFASGARTGDWLAALDDFRNWLICEAV